MVPYQATLLMTPEEERDRVQELHRRLSQGDPHAHYDLTRLLLPWLVRRLESRFSGYAGDPNLVGCALQALTGYLLNPASYQPGRRSLRGFLWMAARGDALNLEKREKWRRCETADEERLAQEPDPRNTGRDWLNAPEEIPGLKGISPLEVMARVRGGLRDEADRRVLELMLAGEATVENCAAALNLVDEPPEAQKREAKRARDRVQAAKQRVREYYEREKPRE
jgi:hypothetical protein